MGKPTSGNALVSYNEYIVIVESNPVNCNILVTGGKERKIDSLSSGERRGNSPNQVFGLGVVGLLYESKKTDV